MRVELLVNLKIESGKIETKGTVYDNGNSPFPQFVEDNMDNKKIFKLLPNLVVIPKPEVKNIIPAPAPRPVVETKKENKKELIKKEVKELPKVPKLVKKAKS